MVANVSTLGIIRPMTTNGSTPTPRAIGAVRVSERGGRDEDQLHSPDSQKARIATHCQTQEWRLVHIHDEGFVSGGLGLAERPQLLAAVEAIEKGDADILLFAFKDRLDREPAVRDEVIDRVEAKGGIVWAVDTGQQTNATPAAKFTGGVLSMAGRMVIEEAKIRSREAVQEAINEGKVPWRGTTPGYRRKDSRYVIHRGEAEVVRDAFSMRLAGATVKEVRAFLAEHGIVRSFKGTCTLLRSKTVVGEIHFGTYIPNLSAHDPIVDRDVFDAVQKLRVTRGRRAKSEMLLARLSVLRCATCGARMVANHRPQGDRYRCPQVSDCPRKTAINAAMVEEVAKVNAQVIAADAEGQASARAEYREALEQRDTAAGRYETLVELLTGRENVAATRDKLDKAEAECKAWQAVVDELSPLGTTKRISLADWDSLTLEERRIGIRTTIAAIYVHPGRGTGRIEVKRFGQ